MLIFGPGLYATVLCFRRSPLNFRLISLPSYYHGAKTLFADMFGGLICSLLNPLLCQ